MGSGQNKKNLKFFCSALCLLSTVFCPLTAQASLIRDAEIEHTLRVYGDPVFKAAGLKPSSVRIFIVGDDSLNAFVAGGANMFIHTGLILATDSPDMLIGVMAHETGHIAGGHLAQGSEAMRNAQIGSILSYVLGAAAAVASKKPEAAGVIISGGQNTAMRNFLSHTRANEEAADQSALGSLDALGISASGMMKVFALLQRNERLHSNHPDPYLLTHPLSATRLEYVRHHVEESKIPQGQYPPLLTTLHQRMIAKLHGFLQSPEQTLRRYPLSDKSVPARMARAVAYYKMPDLKRSLTEIDSLIAESKNDPFFHELKGQILFENGKPAEALFSYAQANRLLPDSPLILTDLAKVELAQDDGKRLASAITHLEKATALDNSNGFSWRLLATAYGKAGEKGKAYVALAEEALLENDAKTALSNADAALSLLKNKSPAQQRAQDIKTLAADLKKQQDEQ